MFKIFKKKINGYSRLVRALEQAGVMTPASFKEARKKSKKAGVALSHFLLENSSANQERILEILSDFFNTPSVKLQGRVISPQILNLIPRQVAEQHSVVTFKKHGHKIYVATTAPEDKEIMEFIKKKTNLEPEVFITTPKEIKYTLIRYKNEISEEFASIIAQSTNEALSANTSPEKLAQFFPIIRMVNSIIEKAVTNGASDIHVEPKQNKVIIRFRIDGLLHKMAELPLAVFPAILARLKILSNLKIDEHRIPQDGRFQFSYKDQEIAIRVSIIPTLHGSKVALRLLEKEQKNLTLRKLGLNRNDYQILQKEIRASQGMILVTGPTGSGKTTTLYSLLRLLNSEHLNVCTIEDPIEYDIEGITQTQINPAAGLTFANGLKAFLRQDPNVLMVGEIRDLETAEVAINAAMTGHLVLSTLHTNNAFLAPQRLTEMGVPPYLISSVINLVIAQRLVRKICPHCKTTLRAADKLMDYYKDYFDIEAIFDKLKKLNLIPAEMAFADLKFYHGHGCPKCNNTGFAGRIGIYETLKFSPDLRNIILKNPQEEIVRKEATRQGTLTMAEDGLLKVFLGKTTFDEVLRVTKE